MRVELGGPDELFVVLDVTEVSRLLARQVSEGALQAGLPGQAGRLADAVMDITAEPRTPEPKTIRSVTIRVVETRTVASETLMLDSERRVYT